MTKYYCYKCNRTHNLNSEIGKLHISDRNRIIRIMHDSNASYREINRMLLSKKMELLTKNEKRKIEIESDLYYKKNVKINLGQIIRPKDDPTRNKNYKPSSYIKDMMKNYEELPLIDVIKVGKDLSGKKKYEIVDGFHRYEAAINLNKKNIYVNILKEIPEPDHFYWEIDPF